MGDLLGLQGLLVNFVVRRVKKMVPEWSLPGHIAFNDALKAGAARRSALPVPHRRRGRRLLQYRRHDGRRQGATLLHRNVLANVAQNILGAGRLPDQA